MNRVVFLFRVWILALFTLFISTVSPPYARQVLSSTSTTESPKTQGEFPILALGDKSTSVLTLHELLGQLGYLPLTFHPVTTAEGLYLPSASSPLAGTWSWKYPDTPNVLKNIWDPSLDTEITRGAVMTFELEHGLPIDGYAGPRVFRGLQWDKHLGILCEHPYTHVFVRQTLPQSLKVWQDGKVVFTSTCSTGISAAPTHTGTHVIYLRNREQTMDGDTPSGGHYRVDHVPFVSFFYKGEAIHGLERPRYGFAQSVGCVELPIPMARRVWQLTDYGTLVTVEDSSLKRNLFTKS